MLERRYEHLLNTAQAGVMGLAILLYCSQQRHSRLLDHAVGMFFVIMAAMLFAISKPGYGLSRRGVQT